MRCFLESLLMALTIVLALTAAAEAQSTYNLGRAPTEEEVRAWDIAVGPSGKELPPGSGTAKEGAKVYAQKCAACHGATENDKPQMAPKLIGGKIGSYWPFATTIWDYIRRDMPRGQEGSLKPEEVYAATAFLLYKSGIIKEDDLMDARTVVDANANYMGQEDGRDVWDRVNMIVNSDPSTGAWNNNHTSDNERARLLIHELGHVFNVLAGAGGSAFKPDDDAAGRSFNADLEKKCIDEP